MRTINDKFKYNGTVDGKQRFIGVDYGRIGFQDKTVTIVVERDLKTGILRVISEKIEEPKL